jgi:cytochrome c oxidase subunit 2
MQMAPSIFAQASFWLEPAASTSAQQHDTVFYTVLWVTAVFFALVVGLMLLFIALYRRRKGEPQRTGPTHNTPLEVFWTGIPLATVIGLFVMGLHAFVDFDTPPADATTVDVEARQWAFSFTYPNGAVGDKLYLELDRPAVLQLHSSDVLHAVYIPAFRVQRNAVPGRTTEMWVRPVRLGSYHIFCTQYCGDGHSRMNTEAVVLDSTGYSAKLAELANIFVDPATKKALPYAVVGKRLYESNGCGQCHTIDGSPGIGPTWLGLYKQHVAFSVAPPGYTLSADDSDAKWDAYLRQHILNPGVTIVKGYQNVMQPYADRFSGSPYKEKKLAAIVEFIKSLGKGRGKTKGLGIGD